MFSSERYFKKKLPSTSSSSTATGGRSPPKRPPPPKSVNPIFEEWLLEWKEDAIQKNSKMQYVFGKAVNSLRKYPLRLHSGKECIVLEFFGEKICKMIDQRMAKEPHLFSQGSSSGGSQGTCLGDIIELDSPSSPPKAPKRGKQTKTATTLDPNDSESSYPSPTKKGKTKKPRSYIPAYRSGGYALLATLFLKEGEPGYRGYMLKSELLLEAQEHCESSLTKPDNPSSKYTAWSSMATLVNKSLIHKQGNPIKFMLSVEGRELARRLLNANGHPSGLQAAHSSQESSEVEEEGLSQRSGDSGPASRVQFTPAQFEIVLYVDNGEASAKGKKEEVIGELKKNGVPFEVVKLNIGDFVWIARKLQPSVPSSRNRLTISKGQDVVLPYVVERKRQDDFAHSIKDGRFHEQKHRLEATGLKAMYLVEGYGTGDWGLAEGALNQALANTQITEDFLIHETSSLKDTTAFLTHMTRHLSKMYLNKTIWSCRKEEWEGLKGDPSATYLMTFNDFNEFATKKRNWTVSEMFARHLLKVRGLSVERVRAVVEKYPTLQSLLREYDTCRDDKDKASLLAYIRYGTAGKTLGTAVSTIIFKFYTDIQLHE